MQVKQTHSLSMEKPLISFIVTYYNLPLEMLCECIESILSLSLRPYEREIIIVDDGSNSCPMNALMKYGSDILYLRKSNGGVSTARNLGLRTATGQYIQFIDADDRLVQPAYEHCIDLIRFSKAVISSNSQYAARCSSPPVPTMARTKNSQPNSSCGQNPPTGLMPPPIIIGSTRLRPPTRQASGASSDDCRRRKLSSPA